MLYSKILKNFIKNSLLLILIIGCSSKNPIQNYTKIPRYSKNYQLVDKSGTFFLHREAGNGKNKTFLLKSKVFNTDRTKVLEESVMVSKLGFYKNIMMARPIKSLYNVWFESKKYQTKTDIIPSKKLLNLKLKSPEEQWNGKKEIKLINTNLTYCYFSEVIDCAFISGFIKKAIELENGSMNLVVVWEGFPYIQEQYLNLPKKILTKSVLSYDGKNKTGEYRFSLDLGSQKILYFVDIKKGTFNKLFWVSQGLTIIEI